MSQIERDAEVVLSHGDSPLLVDDDEWQAAQRLARQAQREEAVRRVVEAASKIGKDAIHFPDGRFPDLMVWGVTAGDMEALCAALNQFEKENPHDLQKG